MHLNDVPMVACERHHAIPGGSVTLLGAWQSVTGAMTLVESAGQSVLFDAGVAQGQAAASWRLPAEAGDVDAVVLTHAHNDHVGSLPLLLEGGYTGPIYGTPATLAIAELVLRDGIRLQGGTEQDVVRFRRAFKKQALELRYGMPLRLGKPGTGSEISVHLREAGHILGSSSAELTTTQARVIISGDLGRPGTPILRDFNRAWASAPHIDLVVMETTYGDREHPHGHDDVPVRLKHVISRALQDGGHILVPAFAIGRTQTLLYHLNELVEAGELPPLPVALDTPMGLRVTEEYANFRHLYDREALGRISRGDDPLDFDRLYAVTKSRDSQRLSQVKQPMLIIAGSGMCTGGRIVGHLEELLPLEATCVLFVGYQAPGTPGRAIQEAAYQTRNGGRIGHVRFGHEDVPVRAHVETLSGLSAHADRNELLDWLRALPDVQRIALHHGEPEAQHGFADWAKGQ